MTTVMDALRNAQFNIKIVQKHGGNSIILALALEQLTNAINSLDGDVGINEEVITKDSE